MGVHEYAWLEGAGSYSSAKCTTCYSDTAACRPPHESMIKHPLKVHFSRDRTVKIQRFPREQTWLNLYIWLDWSVNIRSPCEYNGASYRAFRELLINVNWKWGAIGVFASAAVLSVGIIPDMIPTHTNLTRGWMRCKRGTCFVCMAKTNHAKKREQSFGDESIRRRTHLNSIMRLLWSPCCGRWCNKMTASIWTMQQGSSERLVMHTSTCT